jgi:23S rRNA pseudouridine1911/1915/1917 synthase
MTQEIQEHAYITEELTGLRFDQATALLFPQFSRAQHQAWIKSGCTQRNKENTQQNKKVALGDCITITAKLAIQIRQEPQEIPLHIVHEDEDLLIINKPAGLVVHPGAGNPDQTLLNALLHYAPKLNRLPRAGIIHRLDKNTSGLLLITKTLTSHQLMTQAMEARAIQREYQAIAQGHIIAGGTISAPIGRHPKQRTKMAVTPNGKKATTHYRTIKKYPGHTHLKIQLETGRTHQIRVHFAHIHHPLVGDPQYLNQIRLPKQTPEAVRVAVRNFKRQALHAARLTIPSVHDQPEQTFTAPLPEDMASLLAIFDETYLPEKH